MQKTSELCLKFLQHSQDGSDIHRFPTCLVLSYHFQSQPFLDMLENFKSSLDVFMSNMIVQCYFLDNFWLLIYD